MRQPPKTIKILSKPYTVRPRPDLGEDGQAGSCSTGRSEIFYDPAQTQANLQDTILHETLHGVWGEMGLGEHFTAQQEEIVVRALATGLHDTLHRNPSLAKFILGHKKA